MVEKESVNIVTYHVNGPGKAVGPMCMYVRTITWNRMIADLDT